MKRRLVRICVCLILVVGGGIVNLAVAWGVTAFTSSGFSEPAVDVTPEDLSHLEGLGWPDRTQVNSGHYVRRFHFWTWDMLIAGHENTVVAPVIRVSAGWPLLSCVGARELRRQSVTSTSIRSTWDGTTGYQSRWSIPIAGTTRMLPLRPIWPGFAINTVFYAGILWLLFAAPFALRRWRRIKRGLCARCGYPWGAGAVCSECGSAIVRRRTAVHGAPPPATPDPPSNVDQNA
jgi:hypothetical protein